MKRNESYLKMLSPPEDEEGDSPKKGDEVKKKSAEAVKTEKLIALMNSNVPGQKIHDREIKSPFKGLVKKLSKNHFDKKSMSVAGLDENTG